MDIFDPVPLKPCPFCGETKKVFLREILNKNDFWIECVNCGTQQRLRSYTGAIEAWNQRAEGEKDGRG